MVKSKTDLNASTISTIVNIKISIGILQGFVCLFDVRGPPKNGIRDSPSSISLKRLPPHKIFYNPLSQFILATESRCFTELWDGQLGAQRKGETKRWDFTDFCVLLCSVLVVAGEGTACFLAVSDAQAKPRLSTRLQSNPDQSVRSGLICPFSSYHSISTTFTQKGQASRSTRLCRYTNRPKKQHRCSQYDSLGCGIIWMRPLNIIFTEYWIVFLLAGLNRKAHIIIHNKVSLL